ncbi:MAG: hypothetical protein UV73_C0014G0041 [Candidatus Gottesmanbacteria bacterium GW2011_GWA2_43_14]|uniref:Uncharacterized protein n=1 Tax=Candidatus Gottesmanbacteria bacterium GW2011_GWA2_43_14 TaxID=1618443 RepID=A0A0G1DDS7_9BACT|nr:MAG: hypothetical protein UV73_C0014G0041 [Candidatus Gottesmanbacteria bacterium GW2011_GWA2_43_14]
MIENEVCLSAPRMQFLISPLRKGLLIPILLNTRTLLPKAKHIPLNREF